MSIVGTVVMCAVAAADVSEADFRVVHHTVQQWVEVFDGDLPVLKYNHGTVPVPEGVDAAYARGDYIHPLYGPNGEVLTEDYPEDHPHHRGVNWSWATIEWQGETRDMFAVRGAYARPVTMSATHDDYRATIQAESVWQWDDKAPVVNEKVAIVVYPRADDASRCIDVEISLTPLVDGLKFCGRLEAGYSGFNVRMAPGRVQQIVFHTDETDAPIRRVWADYSAKFPGGKQRSGLTILQHKDNPGYPNEWREYPQLNFFQPVYPGGALIPMPKGKEILLVHRLWTHSGGVDKERIAKKWDGLNGR